MTATLFERALKRCENAYDPLNRLKSSNYAVNSAAGWDTSVGTFNTAYNYDLNGNLTDLTRNGPDVSTFRVIDQLGYTYQGNQLQNVEDAAGWEGFKDGHAGTSADPDYGYDENGNLTKDLNKDIVNVTYNHLNLPKVVTKADGQYIEYIYDAAGTKLAQEVYDVNNNLVKKTEYIGEFIYETDVDGNTELALIHHEEGRIVPDATTGEWEYQYKLADHLGNTRVMFTTKPKTWTFEAGFESENATDEESTFDHIAETRVTFNSADANSDGGNEVVQVNNAQPMGAGISLPVGEGDTLSMEAYGYYEGGSGYNTDVGLATFIGAVSGGFGGINGGTEAQQATYDAFNNALSGIGFTGTSDDLVPAAFLNYILFDENMVYYQHGYVQISSAANMNHERISLDNIVAEKQGFAFIYLSNESDSPNPVFFDDLSVTLSEHPVIQKQDYYAYGMEMAGGFQRVSSLDNPYKFNGVEHVEDLGVYHTLFRMYDPALGRFWQVDPLADFMPGISTYSFAFDNPISYGDPYGLAPMWWIKLKAQINKLGKRLSGDKTSPGVATGKHKGHMVTVTTGNHNLKPHQGDPKPEPATPNPVTQNTKAPNPLDRLGPDLAMNEPGNNRTMNPVEVPEPEFPTIGGEPVTPGRNIDFTGSMFGSSSFKFTNTSQTQGNLNPVAESLKKDQRLAITIQIHTNLTLKDAAGNTLFVDPSKTLSVEGLLNERGRAIQKALMGLGADPKQMVYMYVPNSSLGNRIRIKFRGNKQ